MRVISQDGAIDVPYENSVVFIDTRGVRDKAFVRMQTIGDNEASIMAQYSSEEKAKKAMEMLRVAYAGKFITNADIPEDFNETIMTAMKGGFGTVIVKDSCGRVEFNNLNGYIQFPAEEELE